MNINIKRPLLVLDIESTGVNIATDRIIEIALVKIFPDGKKQVKRKLINPQVPIPAESTAIHGITNEMVKDAPTFKNIANELKQFMENTDFVGYNSNSFDIPLLLEEFYRADFEYDIEDKKRIDVQRIFHKMHPRDLTAAYKLYCKKDLEGAHSAEIDALATFEILDAQIKAHPELGNSIETLLAFLGEKSIIDISNRIILKDNIEVFNFGKYKGKSVVEVFSTEPQYYDWMMKKDFSIHTKRKITELFKKHILPQKIKTN
ncbi:MAG: exonuclease domain-containing protein [Chitinophagaceae bacterium]